jgi:hypothetical protein
VGILAGNGAQAQALSESQGGLDERFLPTISHSLGTRDENLFLFLTSFHQQYLHCPGDHLIYKLVLTYIHIL